MFTSKVKSMKTINLKVTNFKKFFIALFLVLSMSSQKKINCDSGNATPFMFGAATVVGGYFMYFGGKAVYKKMTENSEKKPVTKRVAVIKINKGITRTYINQIIKKVNTIKNDPSISGLIIRVDSSGGKASPAEELRGLLKKINKRIPVLIFVDHSCCSAAYMLSAPFKIMALRTSDVGFIGVNVTITKHVTQTFNDDGYSGEATVHVFSSSENKAIYQGNGELNKAQIEEAQRATNEIAKIFSGMVQTDRNFTDDQINLVNDGRSFTGDEALELGLINKTGIYSDATDYMKELIKERNPSEEIDKITEVII